MNFWSSPLCKVWSKISSLFPPSHKAVQFSVAQLKQKGKTHELELITELPKKLNIHFVRQHEQLGLGHAVLCAKEFIGNEPFALPLGDDVYVGIGFSMVLFPENQ